MTFGLGALTGPAKNEQPAAEALRGDGTARIAATAGRENVSVSRTLPGYLLDGCSARARLSINCFA
jgi:hypothetical protein